MKVRNKIFLSKKYQKQSYQEKFIRTDKEARATFILSLVIFVFFFVSIFVFMDENVFILGMPLWFVLSCLGGYLLSVAGVVILVRFFMQDFSLDDEEHSRE